MAEKKKKKFVEKYYTLTEDEMQALITRAKEGDQRAQVELLEVFSNFLSKYTALLYHSKYNLKDYDIRQFLALFITDPVARRNLFRNNITTLTKKSINETLGAINTMIVRYCEPDDVEQTVKMAFLHCVMIYKRKGTIPFSGYLYRYFFYILKRSVEEYMIYQLGLGTFPLITEEDNAGNDDGPKQPGFTATPVPSFEETLGPDEIDEYWVAGDTALPPFHVLSVQERQLLKWRYGDGIKSSDIAFRITEHPNTVREHFNKIRQKLRECVAADLGV